MRLLVLRGLQLHCGILVTVSVKRSMATLAWVVCVKKEAIYV